MNRSFVAVLILAVALLYCAKAPAPPPEPVRVENTDLGIALAALPEMFSVVTATGPTIVLEAAGNGVSSRAVIAAGPEERFGINLVEAVKDRKAEFEAAPGGQYFGNRELGTPNGTAFTARGAYDGPSSPVEETWVYTIHPMANRVLTITYTYPTGQSEERVQHLLELLGEVEGVMPSAETE